MLVAGNTAETGGLGQSIGLDTVLSADSAGFVSPGAPDFDYHLLEGSAAAGQAIGSTTPFDIDGESRDQTPDIGADEIMPPSDLLFSDGFESGTTDLWSDSV